MKDRLPPHDGISAELPPEESRQCQPSRQDDGLSHDELLARRRFLRQLIVGGCSAILAGQAIHDLILEPSGRGGLRVGFRNDAPAKLWEWSREADWYRARGNLVYCELCPHRCVLGEGDRGFCRTRVVVQNKLHTLVWGNPCAVHLDPVEKKPLYHFLPGTSILSIATAGCNLRCINCQNWQISQFKPEETQNSDLPPEKLVKSVETAEVPSIAYTYSEPLIYYEYVADTARQARELGIRNVLVTAGYILERPLRELCRFIDAANVDLKGFTEGFYKRVTGARLGPVLRTLEILREEGVWTEITRLIVPTYSDDLKEIRRMCQWIVRTLGPDVPLHLSRFHPAYKLEALPPTPAKLLDQAWRIAKEEGLHYVYVGNLPNHPGQHTRCPACGLILLERRGYFILSKQLQGDRCPCGYPIAGRWI